MKLRHLEGLLHLMACRWPARAQGTQALVVCRYASCMHFCNDGSRNCTGPPFDRGQHILPLLSRSTSLTLAKLLPQRRPHGHRGGRAGGGRQHHRGRRRHGCGGLHPRPPPFMPTSAAAAPAPPSNLTLQHNLRGRPTVFWSPGKHLNARSAFQQSGQLIQPMPVSHTPSEAIHADGRTFVLPRVLRNNNLMSLWPMCHATSNK